MLEHKMRANPTLPRLPFSTPIFNFRVYKNPGIVIKNWDLGTHSALLLKILQAQHQPLPRSDCQKIRVIGTETSLGASIEEASLPSGRRLYDNCVAPGASWAGISSGNTQASFLHYWLRTSRWDKRRRSCPYLVVV